MNYLSFFLVFPLTFEHPEQCQSIWQRNRSFTRPLKHLWKQGQKETHKSLSVPWWQKKVAAEVHNLADTRYLSGSTQPLGNFNHSLQQTVRHKSHRTPGFVQPKWVSSLWSYLCFVVWVFFLFAINTNMFTVTCSIGNLLKFYLKHPKL